MDFTLLNYILLNKIESLLFDMGLTLDNKLKYKRKAIKSVKKFIF